jgi:PAS domain S-box-containing protein
LAADSNPLSGAVQGISLRPSAAEATGMSASVTDFDWSTTPLGPLVLWSPALRIAVDMLLLSPFPCALAWGPELTVIHNEGYKQLLAEESDFQGCRFEQLWAHAWDSLGAAVFMALEGRGSLLADAPLPIAHPGSATTVWFTGCLSPLHDDRRTIAGFLHTLIETTASVETTRRWRELAQSFEARLEHHLSHSTSTWQLSPDLMLTLDKDLQVRMANPTWHNALGWPADGIPEYPLPELFHPADRTEAELMLSTLLQGAQAVAFDGRVRHHDGHYCWFRWHGACEQGVPTLVGRDISEERQAVQRLAQAAVEESQRMDSVVKVAGGLGHEMNNVLSGVSSSLELLDRRLAQGRLENLASYVAIAREAAGRAIGLTHNLLAFARSQPLSPSVLDIKHLLESATPLLQQTLGSGMRLHWHMEQAPWPVRLDPDLLRNALMHLCRNAHDACLGQGNVSIRIANERVEGVSEDSAQWVAGDHVVLQVEDDGHGMSPDDVARAFEPFFTSKPLGQGAGLGLPMVHGFVQQSSGQIWIESQQGQGTRVVLMFPRCHDSLPEPLAGLDAQVQGGRLLLVDDETSLRGVMKEALVEHGFEVCAVADANSALAEYRNNGPFELVVTDIGLPGGFSGRQVARALRLINPEQKIMFITGFNDDPEQQALLDEPGTDLLLKPFSLMTLVERIQRLLQA